jgi:tRNA (mo5U34)-methyltransferase
MDQKLINEMNSIKWWHRIDLGGIFTPGFVVHGPDGSNFEHTRYGIPQNLTGKTILDIGAWDGFFSFACEKRNALRVVAADLPVNQRCNWGVGTAGFEFAKKVLNSKVEFQTADINQDISHLGMFDITLQYGVLYHLDNMLPALKNTFAVTKEYTLLETALIPPEMDLPGHSIAAFLPGYANDYTNKWYPNQKCLVDMLKYIGYTKVEVIFVGHNRITVKAYK